MSDTVQTLVGNALTELGLLAAGETLSANDGALGLSKLNRMLDSWNTRKLYVYVITKTSFAFGTSKQSYTIGPLGADFTAARPVRIDRAQLIIVGTTDVQLPLRLLDVDEYSNLAVPKLASTFPTQLYYQPTFPNGTLWPWPYPTNTANKLDLNMWTQLSKFTSLNDSFAFPPGYEDAITYSLSESMGPSFGKTITEDLKELARKARANIQSLNVTSPLIKSDFNMNVQQTPYFNYRTGGFR